MLGPSTLCMHCTHLIIKTMHSGAFICDAFPDGIPWEIAYAEFDHRKPHPEDNGIQFELVEGEQLPDWIDEDFPNDDDTNQSSE